MNRAVVSLPGGGVGLQIPRWRKSQAFDSPSAAFFLIKFLIKKEAICRGMVDKFDIMVKHFMYFHDEMGFGVWGLGFGV
jgi:hypothetical protein